MNAEKLARLFYTYYEEELPRLRDMGRLPWGQLPPVSRKLMVQTAQKVLDHMVAEAALVNGNIVECSIPVEGPGDQPFTEAGERGVILSHNGEWEVIFRGGDRRWLGTAEEAAFHWCLVVPENEY